MPVLYLIDGSAYVYRAFFALPPLSNSKGLQTNAVYGFTTMLMKILREHRPDGLAVVFDEKGPTLRHDEFKDYKAQRPPMPEGMSAQMPYIHRVVEAFGLPAVRLAGYEADDLIGTLSRKAEAAGFDVVIVTGDKDMFQLLTPHVRIYDPVKDKWYGEAECRERFGVEPTRVVEVMGLMGDATDNIPGVKGIGEKTAIKLITQFGSIDELLRRVEEVTPPRTRALLIEQADNARLSRRLATIQTDAPLEFDPGQFAVRPAYGEELIALLRELEFTSLLKTLQSAGTVGDALGSEVRMIKDSADARRFVDTVGDTDMVALQCVCSGADGTPEPAGVRAILQGLAVSVSNGVTVFAAPPHPESLRAGRPDPVHALLEPLADLLQSPTRLKAVHDLKLALLALGRAGWELGPPWFDTMIADYLLNPNRRSHSLETVAMDLLGYRLGVGQATASTENETSRRLFDEPGDEAEQRTAELAAESASVILRLVPLQKERLQEQGSWRLFEDVEMPLVPVLAEIERNGFLLDVRALDQLSKELERELDRMMETIAHFAGGEFNINSPKQLAAVLFDKLGLTPIRKTKTGYSTDEDTLTQLATQHELPALILNYRSLSKLKSTYVDALPQLVNPETGRLHTSLNQTVAATGRLSSTEPNLQNIPVKGEYGLRIREAFIAPPGHLLLCADYSQIEPRILAHLSQDERLLRVFERGEDIHTATAVEIFRLPPEQITREMRRAAKTVVFGIVYGISPFGLAQNIGVSQTEAKKYIDTYFERYAGVKALLDRTIAEAKEKGYTTTILGRRRPIPELQSADPTQRNFGERMAVNSPIQGSAADLIKVAMIDVHKRLRAELPGTKMILQVHDELIFETPENELAHAKQLVKTEMEAVGPKLGLSVPLKVDVGAGKNWRAAHP
ncbi:MAG TPA: DNA polymerase I [Nitrospiraceae bacterium]|jgi:DNA polymerase-1|nr:DNA polymerase I [Nitrospiraceae bacterium]